MMISIDKNSVELSSRYIVIENAAEMSQVFYKQ